MIRFFKILLLLPSLYLACCALGLIMARAHSGSDIRLSMEFLEDFQDDKNGQEYAKLFQYYKRRMIQTSHAFGRNFERKAASTGRAAVVQCIVMVCLALRGGKAAGSAAVRFCSFTSLVLSFYMAWCALGLFKIRSHAQIDIESPIQKLEAYGGDKNSPEYATLLRDTTNLMLRMHDERDSAFEVYALKIGSMAGLQLILALLLLGVRPAGMPAQKNTACDLFI
ncbi:hypothetical protein [Prosthecobacter vanneervenii]|uniref:Uncharacterized protein n=1 Tax=Prosthecobacter vanneervenii TaxID=48466 RepID=A0A7W8DL18_9BACT|nr:hypothetical protein [Prosthecobacter vanneervenii]MBB5033722.1 hypothetical protein [Prosthecobacter vanneervenii]